jgi:hypothetical protein
VGGSQQELCRLSSDSAGSKKRRTPQADFRNPRLINNRMRVGSSDHCKSLIKLDARSAAQSIQIPFEHSGECVHKLNQSAALVIRT